MPPCFRRGDGSVPILPSNGWLKLAPKAALACGTDPESLRGVRRRRTSDDDQRRTLTIVGDDETDASAGRIGWSAPLARALIGAKIGDERVVRLPSGEKIYEVVAINYPA